MSARRPAGREERSAPGRAELALAIAALASVALLALAACARRVWAADFWWQQRTGQIVAEQGWPVTDTLSYTVHGAPWIELRWLFCWIQYRLFDALGAPVLVLLKGVAIAAAFTLVALPGLRRRQLVATAGVLAVALLAASQRFFVRPEVVTYLLLGAFVFVLDRDRRRPGRALWALPALQVLWVNCHPLYFYGPALVGLMLLVRCAQLWVARRRGGPGGDLAAVRRLALATGAVCAACLLNPYGVRALEEPVRMFGGMRESVFRQTLTELHGPLAFGLGSVAVRWWLVLVGLCGAAALLAGRRIDPFWGALCASQLALSFVALRNLALFSLAAVPFVVSCLDRSSLVARVPRRLASIARQLAAAAVIVLCAVYVRDLATDRIGLRQNDSNQFGLGIARHRYPVRAAEFLDASAIDGRVFSTLLEGSYLTSRGREVFVDPRGFIYGEELFRRFFDALSSTEAWDREVGEWDLRVALVDVRAPLVRRLARHPRWKLLYFDEVASVWARADVAGAREVIDDAAEFERAAGAARARLGEATPVAVAGFLERVELPGPYLALADFLLMNGQAGPAVPLLAEAERLSPHLLGIPLRRLSVAEMAGDARGVIDAARAALEESPDDAPLMIKLGEGYYRLAEWGPAKEWLTRSLAGFPERGATWSALGRIAVQEQDLDEAARCFSRAIQAEPSIAVHRSNLARVLALQGRTADAIAGLRAAQELDPRNPSILRDLATLLLRAGDVAGARVAARRGLLLAPDDPELQRLAAGS